MASPFDSEEATMFNDWVRSKDTKPLSWEAKTWVTDNLYRDIAPDVLTRLINEAVDAIVEERKKAVGSSSLSLPGYGLPISTLPIHDGGFPVLFGSADDIWSASTLLIREICMFKVIEDITNKPEWWLKAQDDEIVAKWKKEMLEVDWPAFLKFADFTPAMADGCIKELRLKADLYEKTGLIPVLDYSACVIKSDKLIPDTLRDELNAAVAPLENVPEDRKDWHPGSNERVLDLVHPSLWPLLYGRSRILTDRRINLQDCLASCGQGKILPKIHPLELNHPDDNQSWRSEKKVDVLSARFQWLPCDVVIDDAGKAKIDSYINNLHPVEHAGLYPIIDKFINLALPAWDVVYRWPEEFETQRLKEDTIENVCSTKDICDEYECYPYSRPVDDDEDAREEDEQDEDEYRDSEREKRDLAWFVKTHPMNLPEPNDETSYLKLTADDVKTSGFFDDAKRIQVIVKLANIHLTPEKPNYEGGSWHVEGQLNEHICATALFYYDSNNITDCNLDFRTPANADELSGDLNYAQSDNFNIERVFAIRSQEDTLQNIGSVLTRPGRAIFFPNLFQHHVSPFSLTDPTRPGHRKILALFLVDPAIPIISTANVPPQQKHWWASNNAAHVSGLNMTERMPPEVASMVLKDVDFPIEEDEAKRIRGELMEERTVLQQSTDSALKSVEWSFCEH